MNRDGLDGSLVASERLQNVPTRLRLPDDDVGVFAAAHQIFGAVKLQGSDAASVGHERPDVSTRVGVVNVNRLVVTSASDHTA